MQIKKNFIYILINICARLMVSLNNVFPSLSSSLFFSFLKASEASRYMRLTCSSGASPEGGAKNTLRTDARGIVLNKKKKGNAVGLIFGLRFVPVGSVRVFVSMHFTMQRCMPNSVHYHLYSNQQLFTSDFLWLQL